MNNELSHYSAEFAKVVLGLLPPGVVLGATIYLSRRERSRWTFYLLSSAAVWFALVTTHRILLSSVGRDIVLGSGPPFTHTSPVGTPFDLYFTTLSVVYLLQQVALILFGAALFAFFRSRSSCSR